MFGRRKSEESASSAASSAVEGKAGGKGRPTPSRKEAEAAARARAKAPTTRKERMAAQGAGRASNREKVRQALRDGDERYLPTRDKGPVRRFVRDFVDSRFSFIDVIMPVLLVTMVLSYSGNSQLAGIGSTVLLITVLLVVIDMFTIRMRLRRALSTRFPDAETRGTTWYAVSRAMQMKFMRLPKAQVKIGQQLPERYR
ncbi:DUF3043 domain-containing protein [Nocardioides acrostichi]|uniref:DUF3043 domain-containing protein n=1 Tax=Nocardioides acrostichi TaxID=2784339 RepID=A0A930UUP5_9ACTN|nr:DUF3043 domain-containing protein [Nocardioides acrostichi]MBF4160526.1 DUF3043 domain-containing protein [Nocardioides acrostichi]